MKVKVKLFATFREMFGAAEKEIEFNDGATMQDLLQVLFDTPQRRERLYDKSGKLRRDVKSVKNGRHVVLSKAKDTTLEDGDVVSIFPPIIGG